MSVFTIKGNLNQKQLVLQRDKVSVGDNSVVLSIVVDEPSVGYYLEFSCPHDVTMSSYGLTATDSIISYILPKSVLNHQGRVYVQVVKRYSNGSISKSIVSSDASFEVIDSVSYDEAIEDVDESILSGIVVDVGRCEEGITALRNEFYNVPLVTEYYNLDDKEAFKDLENVNYLRCHGITTATTMIGTRDGEFLIKKDGNNQLVRDCISGKTFKRTLSTTNTFSNFRITEECYFYILNFEVTPSQFVYNIEQNKYIGTLYFEQLSRHAENAVLLLSIRDITSHKIARACGLSSKVEVVGNGQIKLYVDKRPTASMNMSFSVV